MEKERKWRGVLKIMVLLMLFDVFLLSGDSAEAAGLTSNMNAPFVQWTADGAAWTVNMPLPEGEEGIRYTSDPNKYPSYWYPDGTVIETGVELNLPEEERGQHLYSYERWGKSIRCLVHTNNFEGN